VQNVKFVTIKPKFIKDIIILSRKIFTVYIFVITFIFIIWLNV